MYRETAQYMGAEGFQAPTEKDPHNVDIAALDEIKSQMLKLAVEGERLHGQIRMAGTERVSEDVELDNRIDALADEYGQLRERMQAKLKAINDVREQLGLQAIQYEEPTDAEISSAVSEQ